MVADNAVLRVSFIGYMSQDIEVEGHSTFHITLREDMIEPVSYTHLDVYKRQFQVRVSRGMQVRVLFWALYSAKKESHPMRK